MDKFYKQQNKTIKNNQDNHELFLLELEHGTKQTFTSAFSKELKLLVRGEWNIKDEKRNAVVYFFDIKSFEIKGKVNIIL